MTLNKGNISLTLYIVAFSIILYVGIYVIWVGKTSIANSDGIGVYGAVAFYFYGLISAFIYLISQLFKFNKTLTAIYLTTSISLTVFIAWQPTWFQTP